MLWKVRAREKAKERESVGVCVYVSEKRKDKLTETKRGRENKERIINWERKKLKTFEIDRERERKKEGKKFDEIDGKRAY